MRRAGAVVMAAALAASFGVSVLTAAPAAAAIAVTVDPSSGLVDGQAVTVSGFGFAPNIGVGAAQCSAASSASKSTEDCDLSTSRTTSTDGDGSASMVLRVKRTIVTPNGTVDCATVAEPCLIAMADLSDYQRSSGMTISFDPNAPPLPPPDVSASPNTDLVDRQQVAVRASGFIPDESVEVEQCVAGSLDECATNQYGGGYGQADPTGAVAIGITVRRAILVNGARFDCASSPGACVVTARATGGPVGTAPLDFDGSIPLPPPPSVSLTPSSGLADRQIVTVTGSGWAPREVLFLTECEQGSSLFDGRCSSVVYRQANTDANGTFTTTLRVRTALDSYDPATGEPRTIDCLAHAGACTVNVIENSDSTQTASAPLVFDPAAPPLPPPSATVSPSTDLTDGQTVTVTAEGMPPGAQVVIVQCKTGAVDGSGCDISNLPFVNVDDEGRVVSDFTVKRILSLNPEVAPPPVKAQPMSGRTPPAAAAFFADAPIDASTFDCASAPGACTLSVAFLGSTIEAAVATLSFDPNVPPATTVPDPGTPTPVDSGATTTTAVPQTAPSGAVAATSTTTGTAGRTGPLARTGSAVSPLLQRVVVLLALGGLAMLVSRMRRRRIAR